MDKQFFQDIGIIQQEEETPKEKDAINIETWRNDRYTKKDAHIRAVLDRTNYASLMQTFIQDDAQTEFYMRLSRKVALDLGDIRASDIDRAVGNKTYKMKWWKRGPYLIMGYSKTEFLLDNTWTLNNRFSRSICSFRFHQAGSDSFGRHGTIPAIIELQRNSMQSFFP